MADASLEAWSRRLAFMMLTAFALGFALGRPEAVALAGLSIVPIVFVPWRRELDWASIGTSLLRLGIGVALGLGVDSWPRLASSLALLASLGLRVLDVRRGSSPALTLPAIQAADALSLLVGALALEHRVAPGAWVSIPGILFCLLALLRTPARSSLVEVALFGLATGFWSDHPIARGVLVLTTASVSALFAAALLKRALREFSS